MYAVDGLILPSVDYRPDPDFVDMDTLEYKMCNSNIKCNTALVTVAVLPPILSSVAPPPITTTTSPKLNPSRVRGWQVRLVVLV